MQMAFGPALSAYLTAQLWDPQKIGVAFSIGTVTALAAQVPAGALVDATASKPRAAGAAILAIVAAVIAIGLVPVPMVVLAALIVQNVASCVLTPAIAAITLTLSHQDRLGERFGNNVRFAAIGTSLAAALMGAVAYWISPGAIFFLAGSLGLGALAALRIIHPGDIAEASSRTDHLSAVPHHKRAERLQRVRDLCFDRRLLLCGGGMALFTLGNAAVLPLAANVVTRAHGMLAALVLPAVIIVPQLLTATLSPWFGRLAQSWGRRSVMLLGFAALPIRAMLFATNDNPLLMVCYQALDGISAAVIGVMLPLVVADITRRGGRFNLGMGIVGLGVGIGATLSNAIGGAVANHFGEVAAFATLAAAGVAAFVLVWLRMPNTAAPVSQGVASDAARC